MINEPLCVVSDDFQVAWLTAVRHLIESHWELNNLVVQIKSPLRMNHNFHQKISDFTKEQEMLGPKDVAYTIFPDGLYRGTPEDLFKKYNRAGGFFDRVKTGWGTYFRRMTHYEGREGTINQIGNITEAIRRRRNLSKAAYIMIIPKPGGETIRPLGSPCLNYLAIQAEPESETQPLTIGLMAVYRNHDFLERAYGNYWGLCNLLKFLAREVNGISGPLTCISSHAYVGDKKRALKELVEAL